MQKQSMPGLKPDLPLNVDISVMEVDPVDGRVLSSDTTRGIIWTHTGRPWREQL